MPLPNRVDPFGELIATPARGLLFGNRGGRIHRDDRTLGRRRWASRQAPDTDVSLGKTVEVMSRLE